MDISHSRPHKVYEKAPIKPFDKFLDSIGVILKRLPFIEHRKSGESNIRLGDARKLPLENCSVDFVITSPPYLNAIDYLRGHKLSLIWRGYSLKQIRQIRSSNVGAENSVVQNNHKDINGILTKMGDIEKLPVRIISMLKKYVQDMDAVLAEISRVLDKKGRAVLVIGDSTIKSTFIKNSEALNLLGMARGLNLLDIQRRELAENRRYLPPPTFSSAGTQLQSRMREEVIMTFGFGS